MNDKPCYCGNFGDDGADDNCDRACESESDIYCLQKGDFTIFRHKNCQGSDIAVKPDEGRGADLIILCSLFMDYGHFLEAFYLREDEYKELQSISSSEKLDAFVDRLYTREN